MNGYYTTGTYIICQMSDVRHGESTCTMKYSSILLGCSIRFGSVTFVPHSKSFCITIVAKG